LEARPACSIHQGVGPGQPGSPGNNRGAAAAIDRKNWHYEATQTPSPAFLVRRNRPHEPPDFFPGLFHRPEFPGRVLVRQIGGPYLLFFRYCGRGADHVQTEMVELFGHRPGDRQPGPQLGGGIPAGRRPGCPDKQHQLDLFGDPVSRSNRPGFSGRSGDGPPDSPAPS
jgi:hypothetical protein